MDLQNFIPPRKQGVTGSPFTGVPLVLILMIIGFEIVGCAQKNTTAHVPPAPTAASAPSGGENPETGSPNTSSAAPNAPIRGGYTETGLASWYGVPYHGRRASDGEIYDMYKLTAAHRTLPFNTVVRVTNLTNSEHVDVRIIDRGPFVEDRIIDLSLAAARAIDLVGPGTARVRLELISATENPTAGRFGVQVGAFSQRANAEHLRDQLAENYNPVSIQDTTGPSGELFRVRVGNMPDENSARQLAAKVQTATGLRTFIVRLDDAPQNAPAGGLAQR